MVPVVRHAESRDLWDCARELRRASPGGPRRQRRRATSLSGSTITLTSLGALGGIAATPDHQSSRSRHHRPQQDGRAAGDRRRFLARRKMMNLSSSFDHRIVDGHDAARFIQQLKRLLEHPALIFLD